MALRSLSRLFSVEVFLGDGEGFFGDRLGTCACNLIFGSNHREDNGEQNQTVTNTQDNQSDKGNKIETIRYLIQYNASLSH